VLDVKFERLRSRSGSSAGALVPELKTSLRLRRRPNGVRSDGCGAAQTEVLAYMRGAPELKFAPTVVVAGALAPEFNVRPYGGGAARTESSGLSDRAAVRRHPN